MAAVDFGRNKADLEAAVLASLGFNTDFISSRTGLSKGQVAYRLRLAGVKRADYRNGTSRLGAVVIQQLHAKAAAVVSAEIPAEFRTGPRKAVKG